ncbi:MAG: Triosephosphate isomerase [Candidatus Uhrbacteria bacterium GW2011_GWE2_45_35]|uniref:Triosephosphate isomerase n=1 Tax=Candidatus Uhrbacteria bacterium GW2011_GWE2_45_35 TaxID=1618993 RepID=A0A0G1MBI4_9BACT|nr:MAG: Triosephosphate isomerase [Candidatus Uhrbacteria bacterium GW2011_GWE2_45_35]
MYLGVKDSVRLAKNIVAGKNQVIVCPSFVAIPEVKKALGKGVKLGAQNVSWQESGALTGEVSAGMLVELGCRYVIVGHSERRRFLAESDFVVREKLKAVLAKKIIPILCVSDLSELKILNQLVINDLIVAYEPVWAIGTGKTPTMEEIADMHKKIRARAGKSIKKLLVIYGGSVEEKNLKNILALPEVDGVLIGGASTTLSSLKKILQ